MLMTLCCRIFPPASGLFNIAAEGDQSQLHQQFSGGAACIHCLLVPSCCANSWFRHVCMHYEDFCTHLYPRQQLVDCRAKDYEKEGYKPYWTLSDGTVVKSVPDEADQAGASEANAQEAKAAEQSAAAATQGTDKTVSGLVLRAASPEAGAAEAAAAADAADIENTTPNVGAARPDASAGNLTGAARKDALEPVVQDSKQATAHDPACKQGLTAAPQLDNHTAKRRAGQVLTAAPCSAKPGAEDTSAHASKAAALKRRSAAVALEQKQSNAEPGTAQASEQAPKAGGRKRRLIDVASEQDEGQQGLHCKIGGAKKTVELGAQQSSAADAEAAEPAAEKQTKRGRLIPAKAPMATAVESGGAGCQDAQEGDARKAKKWRTSAGAEVGLWRPMQALRAVAGLALQSLSPWRGDSPLFW